MATNRKREEEIVEFSRRAGDVMHAPYFYESPSLPTIREVINFDKARQKEYFALQNALDNADIYDDLSPDTRSIFDKAEKSIKDFQDAEEVGERFSELPSLYVNDASVLQNRNPDPETAALFVLAITQCMEQGDRKTADYLASLAKTPEKLYELIDGESVTIESMIEAAQEAPKVKPSPFRGRRP